MFKERSYSVCGCGFFNEKIGWWIIRKHFWEKMRVNFSIDKSYCEYKVRRFRLYWSVLNLRSLSNNLNFAKFRKPCEILKLFLLRINEAMMSFDYFCYDRTLLNISTVTVMLRMCKISWIVQTLWENFVTQIFENLYFLWLKVGRKTRIGRMSAR